MQATAPKRRYGSIFLLVKSMKETLMPLNYALFTFSASVKLPERVLRIGMIELSKGIKMPIASPLTIAQPAGQIEG